MKSTDLLSSRLGRPVFDFSLLKDVRDSNRLHCTYMYACLGTNPAEPNSSFEICTSTLGIKYDLRSANSRYFLPVDS